MTLFASKSGSQPETFFKQKLGKQHSWGFKQQFASTTVNQEQKQGVASEKKRGMRTETVRGSISVPEDLNRNVDEKRGFVPSDVNDPTKREFLSQLSKRIFTEQRAHNLFAKIRVLLFNTGCRENLFRFPTPCVVTSSTVRPKKGAIF